MRTSPTIQRAAGGLSPARPPYDRAMPLRAAALLLALLAARAVRSQGPWEPSCSEWPCPCLASYQDGSCAECSAQAVMVNGECKWCTDKLCDVCGPSPANCQTCVAFESIVLFDVADDRPVYKDAAGRCRPCAAHPRSSGCEACNRQGRCTQCDAGFVLVNGACKKCKGGAECKTCRPDTLECSACLEEHGFASPANKTCVPCATQSCGVCQDFRTCTRCTNTMFYLSRHNTCEECLQPACDICNRDGQCTDCSITIDAENGAYTLVGRTCKPCGVLHCERCVAGKPGVCGVCQDGYFAADGGRRCRPCAAGCEACANEQTCSRCTLLSLVGGKCMRCEDPRCYDCAGNTAVCRKCVDARYTPDPSTKRCRLKVPSQTHVPMPMPGGSTRSRRLSGLAGRTAASPQPPPPPPAVAAAAAAAADRQARPQPAIIGGRAAKQGRFPWVAQLRQNSKVDLWAQFCGASLVHSQVLLTAAHCVVNNDAGGQWQPLNMALPQVRLGAYQMDTGSYQERYGKWALPHPLFRPGRNDHDFALILLDKPAAPGTPLARLPPASPRPAVAANTMLAAIGWGYVDNRETAPKVLMEVAVPMVPLAKCQAAYPGQPWQAQFCAGDPFTKDTCQGDSGGPLFLKGANSTADLLVGITSWGEGCAAGFPGVYADVASARSWIDSGIQYLVSQEALGRIPPALPVK